MAIVTRQLTFLLESAHRCVTVDNERVLQDLLDSKASRLTGHLVAIFLTLVHLYLT